MTSLPVLVDSQTGELAEDPTAYMAVVLHRAKGWLAEAQSIDDVRNTKAVAVGYEAVIREKELGFDAQLAATEIVRRCERRIGELVQSSPRGSNAPAVIGPSGKAQDEHYAMAGTTADDFDAALGEARSEGNLSRANVVRKIRGESTAEDPDPYDQAGSEARKFALLLKNELAQIPEHIDLVLARWDDITPESVKAPADWLAVVADVFDALCALMERFGPQAQELRRVK